MMVTWWCGGGATGEPKKAILWIWISKKYVVDALAVGCICKRRRRCGVDVLYLLNITTMAGCCTVYICWFTTVLAYT